MDVSDLVVAADNLSNPYSHNDIDKFFNTYMTMDEIPSNSIPASSERREYKAGLGWYVGSFFELAMGCAFILWGLLDAGWFYSVFFILWNSGFIYALLRQAPWSPIYQGPNLIVDSVGVKAGKWSATWGEFEKFDLARSGRNPCLAVYKWNPGSEEQPHRIAEPLDADLRIVRQYLNARLEASRIQQ